MIGSVLLSLPLAAVLGYGVLELRHIRLVGLGIITLAAAGLGLVWVPDAALVLEQSIGLPGGLAAAMLLVWTALSCLVWLNLHLKVRQQQLLLTTLIRRHALSSTQGRDAGRDGAAADAPVAMEPVAGRNAR